MKGRAWRAAALGAGIAVVVLLVTQRAAGQPTRDETLVGSQTSSVPPISESGGLVLLGSAFVLVAHQLRRLN
jgi:hypothetical protein